MGQMRRNRALAHAGPGLEPEQLLVEFFKPPVVDGLHDPLTTDKTPGGQGADLGADWQRLQSFGQIFNFTGKAGVFCNYVQNLVRLVCKPRLPNEHSLCLDVLPVGQIEVLDVRDACWRTVFYTLVSKQGSDRAMLDTHGYSNLIKTNAWIANRART